MVSRSGLGKGKLSTDSDKPDEGLYTTVAVHYHTPHTHTYGHNTGKL